MDVFGDAFAKSFNLIFSFDKDLIEILYLSAKVSFLSLLISCFIGFPLGAFLAISKFPLRNIIIGFLNSLMGLPPVVVGLIVYLYLSRSGPFGFLGLLYTPTAMIIAQSILIIPIIGSLSCQILEDLDREYKDLFQSFVVKPTHAISAYLYDARYSLFTVILAGFGRAVSEVGAVIIVGGNIDHLTRVMTTAIALETSKGELSLAMALGIILLLVSLSVNFFVVWIKHLGKAKGYV